MSKQEHMPTTTNLAFSVENILKEDFAKRSLPSPRKTCPVYVLPFERRNVAVPLPMYCGFQCGQYSPFPLYAQPFSRILERQNETVIPYQTRTEAASVTTVPSTAYRRESKIVSSASTAQDRHGVFVNRGQKAKTESVEGKESGVERTSPRKSPTKVVMDAGKDATPKKKRIRSHFSQLQLQYLENVFSRQQYLSRDERTLLAGALEMTELQIRNWFQNKRYQKRHRELQSLQKTTTKQVPVKVLISNSEEPTSQPVSPTLSDLASDKDEMLEGKERSEQRV